MVMPVFERVFARSGDRLIAAITLDRADFTYLHKRSEQKLGSVNFDGKAAETTRAHVRSVLSGLARVPSEVVLALPPDDVIATSLELPAAAEPDLEQLLEFEMDRLTPFAAEAVYFGYDIVGRDRENGKIRLNLYVVPRQRVDDALTLVRSWGVTPDRVLGYPESDSDWSPWTVMESKGGRSSGKLRLALSAILAVIATGLIIALVYIPLQRKQAAVEQLSGEITNARVLAAEGAELQNEINSLQAEEAFLLNRKRQQPPVVAVLDELSRAMPDDTWLFRFQYRDGEVQAYGNSQAASALIGLIGASLMFQDPQFRAPVMRDQAANAERFHLTFRVVGSATVDTAEAAAQ